MEKAPVIRRIEKRNWLIFGGMLAVGLLLFSSRFAAGVAVGGAISILGFHTLQRVLSRLLSMSAPRARVGMVAYHYLRLGLLFSVIVLIMAKRLVDPLGLIAGLSVVVLSLLLTTCVDLRKIRLEV